MIEKVSRNYQFTEGDLIYVEDNPALVISVGLSAIKVLMLFDGKIKSEYIDKERIGASWNNIHIDHHSTIKLSPEMKTILSFLTSVPSVYRGR